MTTSFTAPIAAGSPLFRFRDFALRCARGVDFASAQHGDPIDEPLREETLEPAYLDAVRTAAEDLRYAEDLDAAHWIQRWRDDTRDARTTRDARERKTRALRAQIG